MCEIFLSCIHRISTQRQSLEDLSGGVQRCLWWGGWRNCWRRPPSTFSLIIPHSFTFGHPSLVSHRHYHHHCQNGWNWATLLTFRLFRLHSTKPSMFFFSRKLSIFLQRLGVKSLRFPLYESWSQRHQFFGRSNLVFKSRFQYKAAVLPLLLSQILPHSPISKV